MQKAQRNSQPRPRTSHPMEPTKPLPPDPEHGNANRARCAAAILAVFQRRTGADRADALSDLLADLMHWCDRSGREFRAELRRARSHYAAETAAASKRPARRSDQG